MLQEHQLFKSSKISENGKVQNNLYIVYYLSCNKGKNKHMYFYLFVFAQRNRKDTLIISKKSYLYWWRYE